MARIPKTKKAKPKPRPGPSGLMVVLSFAIAGFAAGALVVAALLLRNDESSAPASSTPVVDLNGIPQDGTVLGSPEAEVTLIEYADLQCPGCRAFAEVVMPSVIERYVRPGVVKAEFRGIAFIGPDSEKALRYVLAAGLQDRLWHLQEALYRNQGGENSGWVTNDLVRGLAADIPDLDAEQVIADSVRPEIAGMINETRAQADAAEVSGTPTVFIQVGDDEPYEVEIGLDPAGLASALDAALAR